MLRLGKLDNDDLERLVLKKFRRVRPESLTSPTIGQDCAMLDLGGDLDCAQLRPNHLRKRCPPWAADRARQLQRRGGGRRGAGGPARHPADAAQRHDGRDFAHCGRSFRRRAARERGHPRRAHGGDRRGDPRGDERNRRCPSGAKRRPARHAPRGRYRDDKMGRRRGNKHPRGGFCRPLRRVAGRPAYLCARVFQATQHCARQQNLDARLARAPCTT